MTDRPNYWQRVFKIVTSVQIVVVVLIEIVMSQRISAVSGQVRSALSQNGATTAQIDVVNSGFLGLMNETLWVFLGAFAISIFSSIVAVKILQRVDSKSSVLPVESMPEHSEVRSHR